MDLNIAVLSILPLLLLVPCDECLVCYDNVAAGEPVFIDCNFVGAACAVTNKTTSTNLFGLRFNDSELLYHCAQKSSSCHSGPLNHCNQDSELAAIRDVDCNTWCCDTDRCNVPAETKMNVTTVPANKALGCYQLVGTDEKRVKCMFEDAYCLIMEFGPAYSFLSTERSGTQLCSTKKNCDDMETICNRISQDRWSRITMKECSMRCCTTNYCNPLPWGKDYVNKPVDRKGSNGRLPSWFEPKTDDFTTTTVAAPIVRTKSPRRNNKRGKTRQGNAKTQTDITATAKKGVADYEDADHVDLRAENVGSTVVYPASKNSNQLLVYIFPALAGVALVAVIVAFVRQRRKRKRPGGTYSEAPLTPNDYTVGFEQGRPG